MEQEKALVVFQDKNIRRVWHENEWYFSLVDVISALTDSSDPKQYVKKMRQRDPLLDSIWGTICTPLQMRANDGKMRELNCVNTKNALRLIQSIPSAKAEPFKQWLAQLGQERIDEIQNPELGQNRIRKYYELKGYPMEWIEKRIRGIAIRQELVDEWKARDVGQEKEFAMLTDEISLATFGKTVQEHKEFKGIDKQNLRDHMNDWELIFTMIGEKATTDVAKVKDAQGFDENKDAAQIGGHIAKHTRLELEQETGKSVLSKSPFVVGRKKKEIESK
jgi:DNA-damage-inducible protein D